MDLAADNTVPFRQANTTFYHLVAEYLADSGHCSPDWALWLDIRGTAMGGKHVEAIKMLRNAAIRKWAERKALPEGFAHSGSTFVDFATRRRGDVLHNDKLPLLEAKKIIDLLVFDEFIFDDEGYRN